jgi:CRISPR-associated protein Csd1
MILQRLAEHFDRIEKEMPPPGFSLQKISFCVVLEPDGRLNSFQSLQEKIGTKLVARSMNVPEQTSRTGTQSMLSLGQCLLSSGLHSES